MDFDDVGNYVLCLIAVLLVVPILVNYFVESFLDLSGVIESICIACISTLVIYLFKKAMQEDYPDVFDNPVSFGLTIILAGVFLYILRDMLSMGILTVILTIGGMIFVFVKENIWY